MQRQASTVTSPGFSNLVDHSTSPAETPPPDTPDRAYLSLNLAFTSPSSSLVPRILPHHLPYSTSVPINMQSTPSSAFQHRLRPNVPSQSSLPRNHRSKPSPQLLHQVQPIPPDTLVPDLQARSLSQTATRCRDQLPHHAKANARAHPHVRSLHPQRLHLARSTAAAIATPSSPPAEPIAPSTAFTLTSNRAHPPGVASSGILHQVRHDPFHRLSRYSSPSEMHPASHPLLHLAPAILLKQTPAPLHNFQQHRRPVSTFVLLLSRMIHQAGQSSPSFARSAADQLRCILPDAPRAAPRASPAGSE